jgi:hypothetical protein
LDFTLPGRTYFNLPILEIVYDFDENDFLILNVFSNDVFEKHIETKERRRGRKTYRIIHLTQVRPYPMESLKYKLEDLKEKIEHLKCRILVLDTHYFGNRKGWLRDWRNYVPMLYNNVHLWDEYYYIFTKKLIKYNMQPLKRVKVERGTE